MPFLFYYITNQEHKINKMNVCETQVDNEHKLSVSHTKMNRNIKLSKRVQAELSKTKNHSSRFSCN